MTHVSRIKRMTGHDPRNTLSRPIIKFEEDEPVLAISAKWMKGTNYSKKIHSSLFRQQTLTKTYQNSFMRFQPILLKLTRWMISRLTSKSDTSAKGQSEIMKKFVSMQVVGGQITVVAFALLTLPVCVRISPLPLFQSNLWVQCSKGVNK